MGQKVHPYSLRLGLIKDWESRWFATRAYRANVIEDAAIRRMIAERFARRTDQRRERGRDGGISHVEIERAANSIRLTMHTAKPGIIIGRGGRGVDEMRAAIEAMTGKRVHINVQEVRNPELDAQLVADSIAAQIERRIAFKRAIRQSVQRSMRAGAKGIKAQCGGRLGGSELRRTYSDKQGKIPLHTLRADIDFGFAEAKTAYGQIGIKVWIYRGDVLPGPKVAPPKPAARAAPKAPEGPRVRRVPGLREIQEAQAREAEAAEAMQAEAQAEVEPPAIASDSPPADPPQVEGAS
jgi:small subunit ribosomal protein S3